MTQPISNLVASWAPGKPINLSWTAATDASSASHYEIYVLESVASFTPSWNLIATSLPLTVSTNPMSIAPQTAVGVYPPATSYVVPLETMSAIFSSGGVAPNSLSFSVVHYDSYTKTSSSAVSVSAFQTPLQQKYGAPHFSNGVYIDSFGQFLVNPQDSYEEISSSVEIFLGTIKGQRTVVPDYGVDDMPMNQLDIEQIQNDLNKWEDRANALVSVSYDDYDNATLSVRVQAGQGGTQ